MAKAKRYFLPILGLLCIALTVMIYQFRNQRNNGTFVSVLPRSSQTGTPGGKIDINSADVSELIILPGIGETLAQRIAEYREENGPFTAIDQLSRIEGIGETTLQNIAPYITIGGYDENSSCG